MENLIERFEEEESFISKQELLNTMYISNSQLYRWKRLGLIPQEWFIKQITRTGQRTVFPRNLIVSRVRDILKYKEEFRLDNIGKILSPENANYLFSQEDVSKIKEIDANVFELFNKSNYTYIEILILIILTDFHKKTSPNKDSFKEMAQSLINTNLDSKIYVITFIEYKGEYFTIITSESTCFYTDMRHKKIAEYSLYDVSAYVLKKYSNLIKKDRNELIDDAINEILTDMGG